MFDIQTEAYLRRTRTATLMRDDPTPILPIATAASLILWVGVMLTAL